MKRQVGVIMGKDFSDISLPSPPRHFPPVFARLIAPKPEPLCHAC
jgi:hypothetical protein